jgi:hypothetical protein
MRDRDGACLPYDPALRVAVDTEFFCVYLFDAPLSEIEARMGPRLAAFEPMDHQFMFDASDPGVHHAYSIVATRDLPNHIGPAVVLGLLFCLFIVSRFSPLWLYIPAMLVCVFVLPVFPFLFTIDKDAEEETHSIDELPLEERVWLQEVPAEAVLRFRPLRLSGALDVPRCYAAPAEDAAGVPQAWQPLKGSTCPEGITHRRCAIWGRTDLHGCAPWDGARLGVNPKEAAALTVSVRESLDRLQEGFESDGRTVVRTDRYLVVLQ